MTCGRALWWACSVTLVCGCFELPPWPEPQDTASPAAAGGGSNGGGPGSDGGGVAAGDTEPAGKDVVSGGEGDGDTTAEDGDAGEEPECSSAADCPAPPGGTPCMKAACQAGACAYAAVGEGAPCDDGDPCTKGETCKEGVCGNGEPVDCGACETCSSGQCGPTTPCGGKECGTDSCGNSCGSCGSCEACSASGQCVAKAAQCGGKECGTDSCGNSCGSCGSCTVCSAGTCVVDSACVGQTVQVPAGPFEMGCNEVVDTQCEGDEYPQHTVGVAAFEIDLTEVTNGEYVHFLNANGNTCDEGDECVDSDDSDLELEYSGGNWTVKAGRAEHPVVEVTWYGARDYCLWAGKRLCTEAEWEKAARGQQELKYPWGNGPPSCDLAVYDDGSGDGCGTGSTWPVGSKPGGASPYGALDMAGNVWEWVEDCWHGNYDGAPTDGSAWDYACWGSHRVNRGGSFYDGGVYLRASYRNDSDPAFSFVTVGLRCCRSVP